MSDTAIIGVSANFRFSAQYYRTDDPTNPTNIIDNFQYLDLKDSLLNGRTLDKANILAHWQSTLNNDTEFWDLDSGNIYDTFGNLLNFDAVKCLIIKNRNLDANYYLEVAFKNEQYYIGPNGYRILWEPSGRGLQAIVSSQSQEEGRIRVTSNALITYDIILVGATSESSSSSGL